MKSRVVKNLFVSLFVALVLSSCSSDKVEPKQKVSNKVETQGGNKNEIKKEDKVKPSKEKKEEKKEKEKTEEKVPSIIVKAGCFGYYEDSGREQVLGPVLEIQLFSNIRSSDNGKSKSIWFFRNGNSKAIEGYDLFHKKRKEMGLEDVCIDPIVSGEVLFNTKNKTFEVKNPPKNSDEYLESYELRDIISIKYDQKEDVLLVQVKTPLKKEDGINPVYKLKRVEKRILEGMD